MTNEDEKFFNKDMLDKAEKRFRKTRHDISEIRIPDGQIFCKCGATVFIYENTEIYNCPDCDKDIRGLPVEST